MHYVNFQIQSGPNVIHWIGLALTVLQNTGIFSASGVGDCSLWLAPNLKVLLKL